MSQQIMERTARTAARQPRTGAMTPPSPVRPHERRAVVMVVAAVVAVLLAALWTFAQGWGRGPVVGPDELAVGGGVVHVDRVVSAARPQHAMPGMGTDDDPVAEGFRRVSVDVTLRSGAAAMAYDAERFTLEIDGEPAEHQAHRDILPGAELPPGTQLSGSLMFDVPVEATAGRLVYAGEAGTDVVLPAEQEQTSTATAPADDATTDAGHGAAGGHGSTPAEDVVPAAPSTDG